MDSALPSDRTASPDLGLPGRRVDDLPDLQSEDGHLLRREPGGEPVAGSDGAQSSILSRAAGLRFPDLRELRGRERVDALIDYITETAIARGELEELRLEAHANLRAAQIRLASVAAVGKGKTALDEARRAARPDLAAEVDGARWLVDRCTEQINRLGGTDYDAASRTYTLLSGS